MVIRGMVIIAIPTFSSYLCDFISSCALWSLHVVTEFWCEHRSAQSHRNSICVGLIICLIKAWADGALVKVLCKHIWNVGIWNFIKLSSSGARLCWGRINISELKKLPKYWSQKRTLPQASQDLWVRRMPNRIFCLKKQPTSCATFSPRSET